MQESEFPIFPIDKNFKKNIKKAGKKKNADRRRMVRSPDD
jgi:hypothetical protein